MGDKKPIVNHDNVEQIIQELLDFPYWPPDIDTNEVYKVQTDDTDGRENYGWFRVQFSCDGDAHVTITSQNGLFLDNIRLRTSQGGGLHTRVRKAILILAVAMKMDMAGEGNPH